MPQTPHIEKHFTASETVRDIVIGMSDGLTVPFALAAGLSGAVDSTALIITAGLAEVAAGAIAMGLGGYLAARTDAEHFTTERAREERETQELPETEAAEVAQVFRGYGLPEDTVTAVVGAIRSDRKRWVDFMMKFELGMEEPDPRRARNSALTIALSVCGRGSGASGSLFLLAVDSCGFVGFRDCHLARFVPVWLHQGTIHHPSSAAQCLANRAGRWTGGFSGFCHRQTHRLTTRASRNFLRCSPAAKRGESCPPCPLLCCPSGSRTGRTSRRRPSRSHRCFSKPPGANPKRCCRNCRPRRTAFRAEEAERRLQRIRPQRRGAGRAPPAHPAAGQSPDQPPRDPVARARRLLVSHRRLPGRRRHAADGGPRGRAALRSGGPGRYRRRQAPGDDQRPRDRPPRRPASRSADRAPGPRRRGANSPPGT